MEPLSQQIAPRFTISDAAPFANQAANTNAFQNYRSRCASNTLVGHKLDLERFAVYLVASGVTPLPEFAEALATVPDTWTGISHGIVDGFVQWQLRYGYAIMTINRALATIKRYAALATRVGVIPLDDYILMKEIKSIRSVEGVHLDSRREVTRVGEKKATNTLLTGEQIRQLKKQPPTSQGRRNALLVCLLLDHGLRCGEVADLTLDLFDVSEGTFTLYREKVHLTQTHEMTPDTLRAFIAYREIIGRTKGPLWIATRKNGTIVAGTMGRRAINTQIGLLGQQIGLPNLSPHDCRHSWTTRAVKHSNLLTVQQAGGWKSPAMLTRYVDKQKIANKGLILEDS